MVCIAVLLLAMLLASSGIAASAPVRIVAFGDSATSGWLVTKRDAYPAQLQAALRAKRYDVEVRNAGLPGDTTFHAFVRLDKAVPDGTDIAIVEFGTNDLRRHTPLKTVRANLEQLVRRLQARSVAVILAGLGRLDLSAVARATGVPYLQWRLPRGKYRARDGAHFNRQGYAILVARMLPTVETVIRKVRAKRP
jgi:acyl-CoA thioesterase-1